ncbi:MULTISPECIES: sugar ABC transporter permease [Halocynthiibacter]|uniref:Sugar ABC transporter permease n=1 Tax=Halocynthiibacter halioticoli TaxID=2986804 RepID=A0AAE3J0F0_9RHOB|nr:MULTISPECIES: sugar ABC transporter permease [Halocynthiibacter]MCV6825369.1 sugar ABC transporter permease [Halocynthiibacter halioticoli]MCW4058370.1 sugar ABC transporter permease [Halocynthiibacter sp. SDUM655004]MDE0588610.1 sugar ABC transporter permease [Halocynthiibacter sp. C4]
MKDSAKKFVSNVGIDPRLLGMIGALVVLWVVFDLWTGGRFLTPRNLFNISVQTSSVAIMATGMVFVIVTRHIDLSVGSLLGFIGMSVAALQVHVLPDIVGLGHWSIWIIASVAAVLMGLVIGAAQGWVIGYLTVPAFIVTLGGLLIYRGAMWWVTEGQTVSPLDPNFKLLGGGAEGTLGETLSWAFGLFASFAAVVLIILSRRRKANHGFVVKPVWAEGVLIALAVGLIMGFVWTLNSYPIAKGARARVAEARGLELTDTLSLNHGVAIPVVILLLVTVAMTIVSKRTRFGRYIYATGGNPEAAELSGINTRMLTVKVFALMGALTGISAVVASARLGSVDVGLGTLDELRVIAAAVIGGTALAGGFGTIYGAVIGAAIMQTLQSGMASVGVDAPLQNMVVGFVLVVAVWIDIVYRRKVGV